MFQATLKNEYKKLCLTVLTGLCLSGSLLTASLQATELGYPEKEELKFGFIKLTDMAPIAIAYEKGFFEDEGLYVTIESQANWKVLLDGVIDGRLDGAHMLAGQPIAATIGYGTKAEIITPFSMDLNGNAITVSNEIWKQMKVNIPKQADGRPVHPIKADALKPVVEKYLDEGKPFNMGMVFPVSTHNYELRYWLAAGDIHPGFYAPHKGDTSGKINAQVLLSVTPPPQMPATMEAGTIYGYCVGEPWNQQAVFKGIGVPVVTDYEIWKNNPEKVFGITKAFAEKYPNTTIRLTRALIRAAKWLDENNNANRPEAVKILSQSNYVGADYDVIANSMTGTFEYEKGDVRSVPDFNVFFRYNATYPYYSDAIWYLTQMRRWGQISDDMPDSWYKDIAAKVYRPDIYMAAAQSLVDDKILSKNDFSDLVGEDGFRAPQKHFIDNIVYDGTQPNAYINKFKIGLKTGDKL
ncbi:MULTISPECIES: CmpA/NrtA family ABC transporter substrate-binding protein [unclassified Colwellia]|uniref:CmpA/NrtA family ABC transporter substrate-binding protein n=1 Tax=unclassified Colwellia TaxID=196834 RepID=UPI0015F75337|nr:MULTISPECIES: CmpA/NrtA family ABC transporter substrate-binding protein [unclassified Colwellia]MBA6233336.1 ABC transporter substrate-binding protein [Colwellia sp. MB02u-7]MBA6236426.1 ABC transporter substrate-binding protein [Colwellia sp. MB02u-11]MBA6256960.1 ABC transporter substrate-binding protein [Colwellia sp. MB3u-28]MBA6261034.1 ABC transporter substrate-binding protein [Colwellia sp. MB3u-41]MBA6298174.1 ABC transporter substrate-binding protein [Colwellia sp. MB3u-22]